MIPNIFGKNDDYIIVLPISFWALYAWYMKFTFLSVFLLSLGIVSLISRAYISQIKAKIENKEIKNTTDFANFMSKRPIMALGSFYLYFTAMYGFAQIKILQNDIKLYFAWITTVVGVLYLILNFIFYSEYRGKVLEIAKNVKAKLWKTR